MTDALETTGVAVRFMSGPLVPLDDGAPVAYPTWGPLDDPRGETGDVDGR